MSDGSIKAGIQFESYKLDKIDFSTIQDLSVLAETNKSQYDVEFTLNFRDAIRFHVDKKILYVTGLQANITIKRKEDSQDLAHGIFIITGLFSTMDILSKDIEESLIKYQAPAILLPYLRASVTFTVGSAGFSSIILPLINVNSVAHNFDLKIEDRILEIK